MYSEAWNPWLADVLPQMQPDYGQIEATQSEEMIEAFLDQSPPPPDAVVQPRFGAVKTSPTIDEVLSGPSPYGLQAKDMGQQGYGGPALGKW